MIDVHSCIKELKSSWIKMLLNTPDSKWKSLIPETIDIDIILNTGSNYIEAVKKEMTKSFWKGTNHIPKYRRRNDNRIMIYFSTIMAQKVEK